MIQKITEQQTRWNARRNARAFIVNAVFGMGKIYAALQYSGQHLLHYERNT